MSIIWLHCITKLTKSNVQHDRFVANVQTFVILIASIIAFLQLASVLDVKKEIHHHNNKLLPHLQRLVYQVGASRTELEDGNRQVL